jgi:3-methyladenine DNA glycosylase/8-oxoguanine DNA glycosylase
MASRISGLTILLRSDCEGIAIMKWTLPAKPPFSLPAIIRSHGWVQLAPFASDEERHTLSYVAQLDSGPVVEVRMAQAGAGVDVSVEVPLDHSEQAQVSAEVVWMLGLDQDLSDFDRIARSEPKLAGAEEKGRGRVLRSPTLFEDTVKTILTTNTGWSSTIRMVAALVSRLGAPLEGDPARHAFPAPTQLAASNEETLRSDVRLGYRAPYILDLARAVASGDLDLEGLKHDDLPTPELRKRLLAIKGVGDYAAANLLVLLGRYDFVPVDSWAMKVVSHEWYDGQPVGRAEVEAAFEPWGAFKGLAYWFWEWAYLSEG